MGINKRNIIGYCILFIVTFLFLQVGLKYHFFYIEQFQLFLTTYNYFIESLLYPGGLVEYVASFFVQFFILPFAGAIITAFFLTTVYILADRLLGRIVGKKIFFIGSVFIFFFHLFLSLDAYCFFQAILSYTLCMSSLLIVETRKRFGLKLFLAFLLTPIIYWIAGSISILWAFCFALMNLREKNKRKLLGFVVFVFALFISYLSVSLCLVRNYRVSFFPDMYYHTSLKPDSLIYLSWIVLPFWIIIYQLLKKIETFILSQKKYFLFVMQLLLIAVLLSGYTWKYSDIQFYRLKKLDYFARYEQWDKIINYCEVKKIDNLLSLCYQNLALAQKGKLTDKLFYYRQQGVEGLEVLQNNIGGIAPVLSDIRFFIGDIAISQRHAFEGNIFTQRGSGRLMKRLVQTNLIYGEYRVAEKYIKFLENTLFYRKWACEHRRFLFNDSLCATNHLFLEKRKFLPPESRNFSSNDILEESDTLFRQNSQNKAAEQYMFAGYLLAKDIRGFEKTYSKYKCEGKIVDFPDAYQQALLVFYEDQPEEWANAGISEENIRQFKQYKITMYKNKNHPQLEKMMMKYFGTTYWFFLHFR